METILKAILPNQHKQQEDQTYMKRDAAHLNELILLYHSDRGDVPLQRDGSSFHYRSRLCARFPYLLDITHTNGNNKMSGGSIRSGEAALMIPNPCFHMGTMGIIPGHLAN